MIILLDTRDFLPQLLLSSYDAAMENTCRRLFFRWFREAAERMGGERIVNFVKEMLLDEGEKWEKRQKRLALRKEIKKAGQG